MNNKPFPEIRVRTLLAVGSSQIAAVGYDDVAMQLVIRFNSGGTYAYSNVTEQVAAELVFNQKSVGSYFIQNIKRREDLYPFVRIEDPEQLAAFEVESEPAWLESLEAFRPREVAKR